MHRIVSIPCLFTEELMVKNHKIMTVNTTRARTPPPPCRAVPCVGVGMGLGVVWLAERCDVTYVVVIFAAAATI